MKAKRAQPQSLQPQESPAYFGLTDHEQMLAKLRSVVSPFPNMWLWGVGEWVEARVFGRLSCWIGRTEFQFVVTQLAGESPVLTHLDTHLRFGRINSETLGYNPSYQHAREFYSMWGHDLIDRTIDRKGAEAVEQRILSAMAERRVPERPA